MEDDIDAVATQLGEELIANILDGQPIDAIKGLLDQGAPIWYQNLAEGTSPLHAAAYTQNLELIKLLIERGAVWNAVDYLKNTPGDICLSFNNEATYNAIRDAGIRSELILGLLEKRPLSDGSTLILRGEDDTATGSSEAFLSSKLKYVVDDHGQHICLLEVEGEEVGVMMGWEEPIMRETVHKLCDDHPHAGKLKILNIGFGLGIIDNLFQSHSPVEHVIIEAHPDVLAFMRKQGWYDKRGVKILEGRWQDFVDTESLLSSGGFDVVYTDTFSEDYGDLRQFFDHLPDLLADGQSRFSFFNGLGATNALFYDVYTHISELHLSSIGLDLSWSDVHAGLDENAEIWGKSREYFSLPIYRLPIGRMKSI
ncbi:hypothetical protein D9613_000721 [Agrocybe pediades]|uniref:Arginine N-methyltransferase 2 n=1 Tax=Agrocybe pediades TaxID=84607 RepID=A0A8H4R026_9AGAR|nr:hypothetical protein D9613_000721 [Agrocybe pediades]